MPDDTHDAAERRSYSTAREHVGAAGFAQRDALERLISAGREQILFTASLREVLTTTLAQLHALPLANLHEAAGPHVTALEHIAQSSRVQLDISNRLRVTIQDALTEVRGTPIEQISAQLLTDLAQLTHQQAADLQALIALALNEASTVGHITTLRQLSDNAKTQLLGEQPQRSERQLHQLDQIGQDVMNRLRVLEEEGAAHAEQKAALEREATAAQTHIAAMQENAERQDEDIARMERENEILRAHTAALEAAALETQEKIARLRQDLERQLQVNEAGTRRHETSEDALPGH
ncbi:hypothetical protein [Deinococcus pimensis]|uniref:hypothetical protein n=1 Tax=Deinococcus pimensis TaxID=309888 RepID=UPI00047F5C64|nr:hypothetical protein [Deinococcus pimensis]